MSSSKADVCLCVAGAPPAGAPAAAAPLDLDESANSESNRSPDASFLTAGAAGCAATGPVQGGQGETENEERNEGVLIDFRGCRGTHMLLFYFRASGMGPACNF